MPRDFGSSFLSCVVIRLLSPLQGGCHPNGAHPPHPMAITHLASRIGLSALLHWASFPLRCGGPVEVGVTAVSQMAPLASPSLRQQSAPDLCRYQKPPALPAHAPLVLEHLPLADALASLAALRQQLVGAG